MDNGAIDKPHRDYAYRNDVVCAVQSTAYEALLFAVIQVADQLPGIFGAADPALAHSKIALA
jgi:hypothetical protein